MKRFQYGVCEWSVKTRGKDLCKLAKGAKLDCLQLGVGEEVLAGQGLGDSKLVEEYQLAAKECGIKIESLAPQFVDQYSFTMPQSIEEEQIASILVDKTIDLCSTFGCRSFLLPVLCKNDICDGTSFHRAVEWIRKFSKKASEFGIKTYLELNQSIPKVYDLLDAVDNRDVKIYFDSQNLYAQDGTSMARYFKELSGADLIGGVHLKDGIGPMLSGSLLGEGTSGFYQTAKAIIESSYSGSLIIESVYAKPTVSGMGTEQELLTRDASTLHKLFD